MHNPKCCNQLIDNSVKADAFAQFTGFDVESFLRTFVMTKMSHFWTVQYFFRCEWVQFSCLPFAPFCQTANMVCDSLRSARAAQKTDKSLPFPSALNGVVGASLTMSISEFFNDFQAISKLFFAHSSMRDATIIGAATATAAVRIYIITTMAWNYFWNLRNGTNKPQTIPTAVGKVVDDTFTWTKSPNE